MKHQAMLLAALLWGCSDDHDSHDHSEAHPDGHDHHEAGHGHGGAVVGFTLWSDDFELFGEHGAASAGAPVSFLLHITALDGFRAVTEGSVELALSGPATAHGSAAKPIRPGIFRIELTPPEAGTYKGAVKVTGPDLGVVEGLEVRVFATAAEAEKAAGGDDHAGQIEFLKEQQWNVPFATAFAATATLNDTTEVAGRVQTPPGGSAEVGAPVAGRVIAPRGGIPFPGTEVAKNKLLATIAPTPSSPEAATRASMAVAEAEARASAARKALERAERLIADEAISVRALEEARREADVAAEGVRAARSAAALYSGATGAGGRGSWRVVAPIAGVLDAVMASPGKTVAPGTALFRIVNTGELWLVARVPEQDAARLRTDLGAAYQVAGLESWTPIVLEGESANASVVSIGKSVDARSRTVEVIYALREPDPALRVNGLIKLALPTGESYTGVAVPRGAVVDREGRSVVYVQVDGEHFAERAVRVLARAGSRIAIAGVEVGERVVTRGAHLVRLAESAAGGQAHGHIH